ncbi:carboxylase [Klebsiella pneumoniae]|uniref:Carboxylase n=1 Tax=Klebsiella pneumoniae TaxID=573 RepID=A0A378BR57_KLEPN|nr:carboxylase [Klebsiella pneumoniae]
MKTLNALACNGLEQLADGVWQRHSRFSQAVNFVHADGTLLTLFRYGKGMGPTGILLSSTQFAQLANLPRLVKQGRLLWGAGVAIRPRRTLKLRFPVGHSFPLDLSAYSRQSGLRVALNQPLADMPFYSSIMGELERWRRGDLPDWGWLIGNGPGLTPSGDDMLAGMLAMLYGAGFF